MLGALGYTKLVNMQGGFLGATDMLGRTVEPGWQACGLPSETTCTPGRSYAELRA